MLSKTLKALKPQCQQFHCSYGIMAIVLNNTVESKHSRNSIALVSVFSPYSLYFQAPNFVVDLIIISLLLLLSH